MMDHNALKLTFFVLFVLLAANQGLAQAKPACEPKSCGPGNTKTSEAKVITDLRAELQSVIASMGASSVPFSPALTSYKIAKGNSDDESVLFIAQAASFLRTELIENLPDKAVIAELRNFKPTPASSKQQLLKNVKAEVQLLVEQVSKM